METKHNLFEIFKNTDTKTSAVGGDGAWGAGVGEGQNGVKAQGFASAHI